MRRVLVLLFALIALAMTACQDLIVTDPLSSTPSSSSSPEPEGDDESDEDSRDEPSEETAVPTGAEKTVTARLTGYSYWDNTPPGSADICCGVIHDKAGGTGTYNDPITTAVPGRGGKGMETPDGTRLYVPDLKRYFIEDSGATKGSKTHFDLWVGGRVFPKSASDKCMNSFTGDHTVILNPAPGKPVTVGPLSGPNGCVI